MLDLSSVLAGGGIVPFVGCAVVTEQAEQITAQALLCRQLMLLWRERRLRSQHSRRILSVLVKRLCRKKRNRRLHCPYLFCWTGGG